MLAITKAKVADCLERAEAARVRASCAVSAEDRDLWLRLEQRWHWLAQSYLETDRLTAYVNHAKGPCADAEGAKKATRETD